MRAVAARRGAALVAVSADEAFARAVAGEAPYPVSLDEITTNVRTFEAITRSALSGKLERV